MWSLFGVEWNDAFLSALGFDSGDAFLSAVSLQLHGLLDAEGSVSGRGRCSGDSCGTQQDECSLLTPVELMDPYLEPITAMFGDMLSTLMGTTATGTISFGIRMCFEHEASLCFGGTPSLSALCLYLRRFTCCSE